MYWLLKNNETNDTNTFYQKFNKSAVIEFNDLLCYNMQSTNIVQNKEKEVVVIYDIYIKGNLIKYVSKEEEQTFNYETIKIDDSSHNDLLIFKNIYRKTDNCKMPLLIDCHYDNVYKNKKFKIVELPNNTLQIHSENNNFILSPFM
jgi:hypothetical protein